MTQPKSILAALISAFFFLASGQAISQVTDQDYWTAAQADEVLAKTRRVHLDPDLSHLGDAERQAVEKLIRVGHIMHKLYVDSMHVQGLAAGAMLDNPGLEAEHRQALADLYYMFRGPVASTLDNRREVFLPVSDETPGKNLYPPGMDRSTMDSLLEQRPDLAAELLHLRYVVRAGTADNLATDLATLEQHPVLDALHPGLRDLLQALSSDDGRFPVYALPYSVRWADELVEAHDLLLSAASDMRASDPDFSDYLTLRARDLLSDNYEGGDAAWVRGRFGQLNAQIGSYEPYADALYGVKSLFSFSLLARDEEKSRELSAALRDIQSIQDSLPHGAGRPIPSDIPVGVYNIIADFGQARGSNTASILPNEPGQSRKYGRTILLRYNIMTNPDLFSDARLKYTTAVAAEHADDLTLEGPFYRTLWHEVGHYLGVDRADDGSDLNEALSPWGSHFEEMKADLVSLYSSARLNRQGHISDELLRSIRAGGVLRVLQNNQPRTADQPYQTMQLMQMNYFLENGLLSFDNNTGRLNIHYDRYEAVATALLEEVLAIQAAGDSARAKAFIDRYTGWQPELHGRLAQRLRDAAQYRYRMVTYAALD